MTVASNQAHVKALSKNHHNDWPKDDGKYEKCSGTKLSTNEKGVNFGITPKITIGVKGVK
ncbi:uncharacterized protein EAE97_003483 [Botrytis byssoidea]|uniref:Uncharacterized protein n=1 Tax=Botrytis byssoidea TaxID=139641 RepID=A0A9P5IRQ2_9HELO|nr:uncharacterized protein EAE97_003483 [Botrytis byssoidea]KAF7948072.1 hypothetical protein EAE97_003483 [Botrytis byssoidea]